MVEKMLINLLKTCDLKIIKLCKKKFIFNKLTITNSFEHSFNIFIKMVLNNKNYIFLSVRGGFLNFYT